MRRRWRALVSLALLLGLAGGVVLTAAAGARRTDTAYPRLLTWAERQPGDRPCSAASTRPTSPR